jgi:hypothetical protein
MVPYRHRAGRARGRHAAERGVGARVDREHQPGVPQVAIQLTMRDARLDGRVHVLRAHPQHARHARQIDRQPAAHRQHVAFE